MDYSSEDGVQNVGPQTANVVMDCLQTSGVVREILENFSSPELRQLSFVNKLWKSEARSVMRNWGHFTAYVKSHYFDSLHPRQDVEAFISDLQHMNPVPFSGINIFLYFLCDFDSIPTADLDSLQGVVLDQPSLLKSFSLQLDGPWLENDIKASPGLQLTKKILQDFCGVLKELTLHIGDTRYGRPDSLEGFVKKCNFPRLKILQLQEKYYSSDETGYVSFLKALLSRAPNLLMLRTDCPINVMLGVLDGSSVVPVSTSRVAAPFHQISEEVMSAIRLESMKLVYQRYEFDFERFTRITPMLLRTSCTTTLDSLWLDGLLAVPLMSYGICLTKVKYLNFDIDYLNLEPRILETVQNFDFARIFPNLSEVEIAFSDPPLVPLDHINRIIEQANAVLREPIMLDRAGNIKALNLYQRNLSSPIVQFFADMFPNTQKLGIKVYTNGIVSYETIWKNWLGLKELSVQGNMLVAFGNLDSAFCGIFPEEVAELRRKDDEYLKRVHIVPVIPALTCLKNLRTLSLNHEDRYLIPLDYGPTFLFSKVTALLAFARQPNLAVCLNISAGRVLLRMTHLEPYVSVTTDLLEVEEWSD